MRQRGACPARTLVARLVAARPLTAGAVDSTRRLAAQKADEARPAVRQASAVFSTNSLDSQIKSEAVLVVVAMKVASPLLSRRSLSRSLRLLAFCVRRHGWHRGRSGHATTHQHMSAIVSKSSENRRKLEIVPLQRLSNFFFLRTSYPAKHTDHVLSVSERCEPAGLAGVAPGAAVRLASPLFVTLSCGRDAVSARQLRGRAQSLPLGAAGAA